MIVSSKRRSKIHADTWIDLTERDSQPAAKRRGGLVWPRRSWKLELLSVAAAYVLYEFTRWLAAPRKTPAIAHGRALLSAERWAHLDVEVALNHWLSRSDALADTAGYYYSTAHFIVTPLVLVWLWRFRPRSYARLRSALFVATAIGLVCFVVWPAAPPRFAAAGLSDTLVRDHIMGLSNPHGVSSLINQYAAMPSLHVGWAIWCASAIVVSSRSAWRHLAWLYPALTTFVVLATANHYVLDAVGGAVVIAVALEIAGIPLSRLSPKRRSVSRSSAPGWSDADLVGAGELDDELREPPARDRPSWPGDRVHSAL